MKESCAEAQEGKGSPALRQVAGRESVRPLQGGKRGGGPGCRRLTTWPPGQDSASSHPVSPTQAE